MECANSALHKTIRISTLNSETQAVKRACKEAARSLVYQTLKDHQILVLSSFVKGNDVFGYAHARVDNDIHSISRTLLRHHTFHGHKSLMLTAPDPSSLT